MSKHYSPLKRCEVHIFDVMKDSKNLEQNRMHRTPLCDVVQHSMNVEKSPLKKKFSSKSTITSNFKSKISKVPEAVSSLRRSKRKNNSDNRPDYSEYFEESSINDTDYVKNEGSSSEESMDSSGSSYSDDNVASNSDYIEKHKSRKQSPPRRQDEVSEYELMVLKNKEEKMAFLKSLNFNEVEMNLGKPVSKRLQTNKKKDTVRTVKIHPQEPMRKSRRLAKLDHNLSEAERVIEATEDTESEKVLKAELPFKEAQCAIASEEEETWDFSHIITSEQRKKRFVQYDSHFEDMYLVHFQKVVRERISALDIHPTSDKIFLCAGSKTGRIGFYDSTSEANSCEFTPHQSGITHLRFDPHNHNKMITSSYDGIMRCADFETSFFNQILERDVSMTYFDFLSPTTLLASFQNGSVTVAEKRSDRKTGEMNHQCHDFSIKTICAHPTDKNYFLTATRKGLISLWDLRKLQRDPVIEVRHHKRSVNSAFFSPVTGNNVLSTSCDDTICLFDSSSLGTKLSFQKSMSHNNQVGRWLSIFRATWLPNDDCHFVVGSMGHPRTMEIYNDDFRNIYSFVDEDLASITSVFACHPHKPIIVGANSSGKVYLFGNMEEKCGV